MKAFNIFLIAFYILFLVSAPIVRGQTIDELKGKITEKNINIKELEEEIKSYQRQIESLSREADSLKNTLSSLDLTMKKLEADLAITENKISATNLEIQELSLEIDDKVIRIGDSKRTISQSLSNISRIDSNSIFETLLSSKTFGELWKETDNLNALQNSVRDRIYELKDDVSIDAKELKAYRDIFMSFLGVEPGRLGIIW